MAHSLTNPMMGRTATARGSAASAPGTDLAYAYRRRVGAWFREARLAAGITQEALARQLGMGHSAISAIELGRSTISPENYETVAAVLGVNPQDMADFILRYSNPWLYKMLFPAKVDAQLKRDLGIIPTRVRSQEH